MNPAVVAALVFAGTLLAGDAPAGFPYSDESLTYSVKWPSGLNLGEAKLSAVNQGAQWSLSLALDASVPGYVVKDLYHSSAGNNLCSQEFSRQTSHGVKKANEKTVFFADKAVRQTVGGGKTEIPIASCGHDALAFLFFARQQFGQGKVPAAQTVLFGGDYQIRMDYAGPQVISVGNTPAQADHVLCTVASKGADLYKFEIYFARDPARTPLLITVPFSLGAISMELVR
jgi:hypothetical protein